jgi:hypothetical protein
MFCISCGKSIQAGANYCANCGATVGPYQNAEAQLTSSLDGPPPKETEANRDIGHTAFWIWFVVLFLLSGAMQWWLYPNADVAFLMGSAVGESLALLAIALVVAAIRRLFTKHGFSQTVLQAWGIIFVLASIGNYYNRPPLVPDHQAEVHAAAKNLEDATAPTQAPAASVPATTSQSDVTSSQAIASVMNQQAALLRSYNVKIQAIMADENALPLGTVLTPTSLASADGIANGRRFIAQYNSDIDRLQSTMNSYFVDIRGVIDSAPSATREQLLSGFEPANERTRHAYDDYLSAERRLTTTASAILDLAEQNLGVSYAKDGQIYLPTSALGQYQSLMKQLNDEAVEDNRALQVVNVIEQSAHDKIKGFVSDTATTSQ